jgi:hypothetical protein
MKTNVSLLKECFFLVILVVSTTLNAQIKVFSNGNVGIKYTTNTPLSSFALNSQGVSSYEASFYSGNKTVSGGTIYSLIEKGSSTGLHLYGINAMANIGASNYSYGLKASAYSSTVYTVGRAYGLYGVAGNSSSGFNYGVYGYLQGNNNGAAVFGTTNGDITVGGKYAGYFYGNIHITGSIWYATNLVTSSDEKIKTNIVALKTSENKSKLNALNPVKYNLRQKELVSKDSSSVKTYYDPESDFFRKTKYGFIAQELKEVYPDLVYEGEGGILGIDYIGLIPIMVTTIQEQQKRIEELEGRINNLSAKINEK